ncbi:hypothetical protein [Actinomyces johnsonii]|jgi:hypothetical protein avisC_00242|uniref:Uncharacterized protein n=2 Tax=Actinomyces johnsonii TaxID=544581 RepID=U1RED4_9ACTO|nr:hypothetical protein [Actinomyces johnsonii]ERH16837.1 hypothetical protein HMPREF1549_02442 [Actinomyces johnsonii F0510]KAA8740139.1 hypothetical protein F4W10_08820 [Actinomyces johnsonii]TQD44290.1 hypothetical protein FK256_04495 [Actinomyces johnsonii]
MTATTGPQHVGVLDGARHGKVLRRGLLVGCVLALILGVTVYCHAREAGTHDCDQWEIVFDGYGEASCADGLLRLKPTSANSQDKTHAGLAKSTTVEVEEGNVQTIHTRMTTVSQLREDGSPNAWEVAWLLWNYSDNNHFYALALKPNGWEVSKQDTAYEGAQRFLASGNTPVYPPGASHDVTVAIDTTNPAAVSFVITVDGKELGTVTDSQTPYRSGAVAAYCEDSDVTFTPITEDQ